MTEQIRAWHWVGGASLRLRTVPKPIPAPYQVLVRVRAVGICRTDLHIMHEVVPALPPPLALGHEVAGEIAACGPCVTHVHPGERCAIDPLIGCGRCQWCRTGHKAHCRQGMHLGITTAGGWQEYLVVPEENCYPLPDAVSHLAASQAETLYTVLSGVDRLQVKAGEPALIIGDGPTGLLFARMLRVSGCRPVVLAGMRRRSLDLAQTWGVDLAFDVTGQSLEAALSDSRFAVIVEAVGAAQTIQQAVALAAPRGRVLLFGLPAQPAVPVDALHIIMNEVTLIGSTDTTAVWPRAISLIADGTVDVQAMVTQVFPYADLPQAIACADQSPADTIKVVVDCAA